MFNVLVAPDNGSNIDAIERDAISQAFSVTRRYDIMVECYRARTIRQSIVTCGAFATRVF
jgi:S-adenosylmethionine hydrolase